MYQVRDFVPDRLAKCSTEPVVRQMVDVLERCGRAPARSRR
jgi:hypothetical protein